MKVPIGRPAPKGKLLLTMGYRSPQRPNIDKDLFDDLTFDNEGELRKKFDERTKSIERRGHEIWFAQMHDDQGNVTQIA